MGEVTLAGALVFGSVITSFAPTNQCLPSGSRTYLAERAMMEQRPFSSQARTIRAVVSRSSSFKARKLEASTCG